MYVRAFLGGCSVVIVAKITCTFHRVETDACEHTEHLSHTHVVDCFLKLGSNIYRVVLY
jgi:hypothetical protein